MEERQRRISASQTRLQCMELPRRERERSYRIRGLLTEISMMIILSTRTRNTSNWLKRINRRRGREEERRRRNEEEEGEREEEERQRPFFFSFFLSSFFSSPSVGSLADYFFASPSGPMMYKLLLLTDMRTSLERERETERAKHSTSIFFCVFMSRVLFYS